MKIKVCFLFIGLNIFFVSEIFSQQYPWQQAVDYTMNVTLDVKTHQFQGNQILIYKNNSPDTLEQVFYHMYFNAFQPGSMMDVRSRNLPDPDRRVQDRISKLTETEIGKLVPVSLVQDGKPLKYTLEGTILEVKLATPLLPNSSTVFEMNFKGQVPVQIRRSGRDNKEGIDYSMAQWYPKISEYDKTGWHPNPYIAREFFGVWGNFDVSITIDSDYVVAASGILQNPNEIGYGYEPLGTKVKRNKGEITYRFIAKGVHDFMWAADPDYVHKTVQIPDGPKMHYFYVEDEKTKETWPKLMEISPKMVTYMNKHFGEYAYPEFFVIQGGDGGMEYPMSTLITGRGSLNGLISVTVHEMFHSWYQGLLATDESVYPWMDEGFTSYAQALTLQYLHGTEKPLDRRLKSYYKLAKSGLQEPMTTQSDHYATNTAYGTAAYSMGALVPYQLAYIMGADTFAKAFRDYYNTWRFHHPTPADFEFIMEMQSGMVLDWFFLDWVGTTKHLDYAIADVTGQGGKTAVKLVNLNERKMPVELMVTYKDGKQRRYYMALRMMRGEKRFNDGIETINLADWPWTNPVNTIIVKGDIQDIVKIELDPDHGMVDLDYSNNVWTSKNLENE